MGKYLMIIAAAVALLATAPADAASLLGFTFGTTFWQGVWGVQGTTPVIVVDGSRVSYQGSNGQPFQVAGISISSNRLSFRAGDADIALTRQGDASAAMVSTIGRNSSSPILLCRSDARHCP